MKIKITKAPKFISSGYAENGVNITPEMRNEWNQRQKLAQSDPNYNQEALNHNPQLGESMMGYNPEQIGAFQQDFQNMASGNSPFGQVGVNQAKNYPSPLSRVDKYPGTLTTSKMYPELSVINEHFGQPSTTTNYGTDFQTGYMRADGSGIRCQCAFGNHYNQGSTTPYSEFSLSIE